MPDLTFIKDFSIVIAGVVALVTFFFGTLEYVRRGKQERAMNFILMRRRFLETTEYHEILQFLQTNDEALKDVEIQNKRDFLGFLEEVALMSNSRLIKKDVVYYMFGYYVCLANQSQGLWHGLDKASGFWAVFRSFAAEMEIMTELKGTPSTRLHF